MNTPDTQSFPGLTLMLESPFMNNVLLVGTVTISKTDAGYFNIVPEGVTQASDLGTFLLVAKLQEIGALDGAKAAAALKLLLVDIPPQHIESAFEHYRTAARRLPQAQRAMLFNEAAKSDGINAAQAVAQLAIRNAKG
jgi:hypothetical protein